jgi:hypothetical protein
MKSYDITIKATVTKTMRIKASNEEKAIETANETFSVLTDEYSEDYEQDIVEVKEIKNKKKNS